MGARVRFDAERDLLLLEQAVACCVYQQQGGRGWKQVANNLIDLHDKFQYITPRCARERTHLLVTKYAAELGQTLTSACSESERSERAILLNQLLHIKQNERNSGKVEEGSRSSHDLPDNIQPKVEFPEATQSADTSFSENGTAEHPDVSEEFEIFHADIPNGIVYKSSSSSRSPRGQKRSASSSKRSDDKEDYLVQLVSSLEETSRKHARLLGEELELRRRELELRAQRLQMEMAERTAMVDLIKALVHKN